MEPQLKNVMEMLVLQKIDSMLDKLDCCNCSLCRMDMAAYVLNRLPCKYVSNLQGELFSKLSVLSLQYDADITALVVMASDIVNNNPRHNISVKL